ncbi:hypothetical protein GPL15_15935 [Clostridium sp. MCC353]|uniref:hypothetical protein n=1 Tax=Clostridium sp. MCC353 TaxID=2592646 RepID=UPI001C038BFA|nr:hypothetical protein [Clostridium sp. MCC353]MBT9777991.1 hypothetical protein [Clostridium sp. MCC353]
MLYQDNKKEFSMRQFADPPAEYRGVPFWAWNTKMTREDVDFCLEIFKKMGMGGGFLHSRTGMNLPYLGDEFMEMISYANEQAKKQGLHAWLYDEDRWPSGFAGGLVTCNHEYRSRFLVWSPKPYSDGEIPETGKKTSTASAVRSGERKLLGKYLVTGENGFLKGYKRLEGVSLEDENGAKNAGGRMPGAGIPEMRKPETETVMPEAKADEMEKMQNIWWAYLEICGDNPWFNGQSYTDTLNPDAVKQFIDITYEKYRECLGADFGNAVPGIFTDEPQFTPKQRAGSIDSRKEIIMPFTDRLPERFYEEYGFDLLDRLPELFYDREDMESEARYCYHDLVSRLFAESYAKQIGQWCREHGIALTGHLMKEPLLSSQTEFVGEAMRSYPGFGIPGIDILCDRREFTTAKQAQSIAHQCGYEAMISELYGVTNWDFDFRGHKLQGDWQAALGVTVRAPHLAWTSMEGEAKRDYPASIFYQSPWYEEYKLIEDYFARIAMVMSRGRAGVKIGVLHPVESCWTLWGTMEKTGEAVKELDGQFLRLTAWLLGSCLDFDFISESLIPQLYNGSGENGLAIGEMEYQAVVVPYMKTMRSTTLTALEEFRKAGGQIVFMGGIPELIEGKRSEAVRHLAEKCRVIPDSKTELYRELGAFADIEAFYGDFERAEDLICQIREDGDMRWLFLAHKNNPGRKDLAVPKDLTLRIKGCFKCIRMNALNGTAEEENDCVHSGKETEIKVKFFEHDSLLLQLIPFTRETSAGLPPAKENRPCPAQLVSNELKRADGPVREVEYCKEVPVTLTEPNVLVLDMPEYSFDGQPWQKNEEILRIDNKLRKKLGCPLRMEAWPQPWSRISDGVKHQEPEHRIELRYYIWSECQIDHVSLALEQLEETTVFWNGYPVTADSDGWYVDRRIRTIPLGVLEKGANELCLVRGFHDGTNLEAVYLLGDFGVKVSGSGAAVTKPVRHLRFGDWNVQGLPFYGGNVIYHISLEGEGTPLTVAVNKFSSPLIRVDYQGRKQGIIAFSPYELTTEPVEKGETCIEITAFGNRINTFGALHNCDSGDNKAAPDYWRTTGCAWSYEYCLRPSGILKAPVITYD